MRPNFSSPDQVAEAADSMTRYRVEHFKVALLDARYRLIKWAHVSKGSLAASIVHPREVFRPAIVGSAYAIIVVHNHPSGDPKPSQDDRVITERLVSSGRIVGIPVVDHVIVGREGWTSLRQEGRVSFDN